jgi:ribosome-associated toxin RatA of RatAB toxin-antitoxin module
MLLNARLNSVWQYLNSFSSCDIDFTLNYKYSDSEIKLMSLLGYRGEESEQKKFRANLGEYSFS